MAKLVAPLKNDPLGRITDIADYGQHIGLACMNHPLLRWHTKNIAPIGARNIFYTCAGVPQAAPECKCSVDQLRPVIGL